MTLAYPKDRHTRTETPREYASYRSYKPYLRREFERRCVYCRAPDTWRGADSFGADHYRPQVIFPELSNAYSNLFYCCNQCNSRKSNFWPKDDEADTKFIPNPCTHRMFEHLRYSDGSVLPRTKAGEFTVDQLDLNDPESVQYRRTMLHLLDLQTEDLKRSLGQLKLLEEKYAQGKLPERLYLDTRAKIEARCIEGRNAIAFVNGDDPVAS